jgi:hypothetical protein
LLKTLFGVKAPRVFAMSKTTDSVSGEIHSHYEETVRKSLKSIIWSALGVNCREPTEGYSRSYYKDDNPGNLWWAHKDKDEQIQIDFLAHVAPLNSLSDVNETLVAGIPNVSVWKSTAEAPFVSSSSIVPGYQQKKSSSPEKPEASDGDDATNGSADEHFQYVIAEITIGGRSSVVGKLKQLEKDCFFLCSRACPTISDKSNFKVLESIAFVAVVSPNPNVQEIFRKVANTTSPYPLLQELYRQGRFVYIQHKETIVVVIQDLDKKMQNLETNLTEQSQTMLNLETNLTEQNEALKSQLSEQNEAYQAMKSQLSEQNEAYQAMKSQLSEQNQTIKALADQLIIFQNFLVSRLSTAPVGP